MIALGLTLVRAATSKVLIRLCAPHSSAAASSPPQPAYRAEAVDLIYELVDAHSDTAALAADLARDPSWEMHLMYLRALQRRGRETLARASVRDEAVRR